MAKLKGESTFLALSLVILTCHGQVIRSPLQPVIAQVGDTVTFTCDTDAGQPGSNTAISWARDISAAAGEETIAMYFNGAFVGELLEPGAVKYNVDVPNKLVIKNVQLSDGGRYICSVLPTNGKEISNLIVVEPPTASSSFPQYRPGEQAEFQCQVRFGAPRKDLIPGEQMPSVKGFVNHKFSGGETPTIHEGVPGTNSWQIRQKFLHQIANDSTVEHYDFICEVHTENPRTVFIANASAALGVPVHDILIEPRKDEYEVGEFINCSAQGYPEPDMDWKPKLSAGAHIVLNGHLEILPSMVGENKWTCHATNNVLNIPYMEEITIPFNVPEPAGPKSTASSNTNTVIIATVVLVVTFHLVPVIPT